MTARWITVSLVALALAGCHKKEAAKPPAPPTTAETPAPAVAPTPAPTPVVTPPTTSEPVAGPPATEPAPPPADVTPATPPATPPAATPTKPLRPVIRPTAGMGIRPPIKIVKTPLQLAAETNVLGAWVQSDQKTSVLRFTPSGWVSLERGNDVINGKWTANSAGAINFSLPVPGGEAKLVAHYDNTKATGRYIVVIPNQDGPQIWPRYGQLIFNPQK
jgi:hypothetical protein